jgi:hypothetical protein
MGVGGWLRVLDTIGGFAQIAGRVRRGAGPDASLTAGGGAGGLGQLEARLAGVVVAALKEAFDRDRARLDLEQAHLAAERERAEAALRAELRRQSADRALVQLRIVAIMAIAVWMLSAALSIWLPGMRGGVARFCLGAGWALAIAALGGAFAGSRHVATWSAEPPASPVVAVPHHAGATAAPWLLIGALVLTAASLLAAL